MHLTALMKEFGAPMTRDEYLRWNNLGKSTKISAEQEAELPTRFAYPVISADALPEQKEGEGKGAPADFPGPVFTNPGNVHPMDDTDVDHRPTQLGGGAKLDKRLAPTLQQRPAYKLGDTTNPPGNTMEHHPLERTQ